MVMFLLSFVKGSKSAEGGPNPLVDMDRGGPNPLGHRLVWCMVKSGRVFCSLAEFIFY